MTVVKNLRLLVTKKCYKACSGCANYGYDLDSLPPLEHFRYVDITITGGEPLLKGWRPIYDFAQQIRRQCIANIYLYTAYPIYASKKLVDFLDGVTVTVHSRADVTLLRRSLPMFVDGKSNRLRYREEINISGAGDLSNWEVKQIEWLDECPLPEGEEFRKHILF